MPTRIQEPELIDLLRRKNPSALEYIYDHYSAALYGVVLRIVRQEAVAEEILQDVFLRVWDKIGSYDPSKGRLFTWMLNIARNLAIDRTRSREMSKSRKTDDLENFVDKIDDLGSTSLAVDSIGLTDVLGRLPDDQRFVVDYLYLRGYTQSELAEESGIPLGTIKTRMRLAITALRQILNIE